MRARFLKILLISENENDRAFTQSFLEELRDQEIALDWISSKTAVSLQIQCELYNVALLDSDFDGNCLETLQLLRRAQLPVIVLADVEEHTVDVAVTEAGAYDYLVKKHVNAPLFERSLRYALQRRSMEAQLRSTLSENQWFSGAIHYLTTGVIITDCTRPDNPIAFVNPAFTAITGYSSEEAIGQNLWMLAGTETDAATQEQIRQALNAQGSFQGLVLHRRKNGSLFWNELRLCPLFENNQLLHWVGLMDDVSSRVESEMWRKQMLTDLSERVKELTNLHAVARTLQNEDVPVEELLKQVVTQIPLGFQRPDRVVVRLSFAGHEYFSGECRKDGSHAPIDALEYPLRLGDESKGHLQVCHRETAAQITPFLDEERVMVKSIAEMLRSRLQQELASRALQQANEELEMRVQQRTQELRDSEERLRRINHEILALSRLKVSQHLGLEDVLQAFTEAAVRSMDIERAGIWIYNEDRSIIECWDAFDKRTGLHSRGEKRDAAGYPISYSSIKDERVVVFEDTARDERIADIHREHIQSLEVTSMLIASIVRAGDIIGMFAFAHSDPPRPWPIEDQTYAGSLADLVALEFEAADHLKMEESLRIAHHEAEEARRSAEAANRAKSEFLSRMSHELRTPLNSILGFSQLLQRDVISDKQRGRVDLIVTAGQHLLALINEVLDLSRVESGKLVLSIDAVKLNDVVSEAVSLVSPLAARHQVVLICPPPPAEIYVQADRQKLQQVFLNLLSNAVKYNWEAGRVRVWQERVAGERLRISIANTGRGIAPEDLPRAFLPFERLGAEASQIEGTGLGLALARNLVEAMGGTIEAKSTPDVETVFMVTLSIVSPVPSAEDLMPKPLPGEASLPEIRVLYIEDNLANLKLVESIFVEQENIRLSTAMQGDLGLELAREHLPDLILLDLHLPDIHGEQVLQQLKASELTASIPVIVLSADATEHEIRYLLGLGAFAYLTKPMDIKQFLECVVRATQQSVISSQVTNENL